MKFGIEEVRNKKDTKQWTILTTGLVPMRDFYDNPRNNQEVILRCY